MPKKLNSAGQMQNYVPKGNGDASGEYGDNASGSNRNWKKPENNNAKAKTQNDNIAVKIDTKKQDKSKSFDDYVANKIKDTEFRKKIKYHFEGGNDIGKRAVNHAISEGAIIETTKDKTSYCNDNGVYFTDKSMTTEEHMYATKVRGETFYHEFWHCIDRVSAKDLIDEKDRQHAIDTSDSPVLSIKMLAGEVRCRTLTQGKLLSNGKTLNETLIEECRQIALNKKRKKGITWDSIQQDFYAEIGAMNGDRRKVVADAKKSWTSISDIYGMYNKVGFGFCGGHESSYTKHKGKEIIAKEFIAEFGSAVSRNDKFAKKELELFKKYFPETSKMCNELIDMVMKKI